MPKSLRTWSALLALVAVPLTAAPAGADPPAVVEVHIGPGPAPFFTAACGFPVRSEIVGTSRLFGDPGGASPQVQSALRHLTGTFVGPTGRTLVVTTNVHVVLRERADGTLVEVRTGRISLFQTGRSVLDLATGEQWFVGTTTEVATYCAALAA